MKIPAFKMPVADAIERGACGVGFVADQHGRASAEILQLGLSGLVNLQHRGGLDADNKTGDGAGVLTPYATGPAPVYYGCGYIGRRDFWRLGFIFGLVFLAALLLIGLPTLGLEA